MAVAASRIDPWRVEGADLLGELPAQLTITDCPPECRGEAVVVIALPPYGPGWVFRGRPAVSDPRARGRLFAIDDAGEWYGSPRASMTAGLRTVVLPAALAGRTVRVGARLEGRPGTMRLGAPTLLAARSSLAHRGLWWGAVAACVGGAFAAVGRSGAAVAGLAGMLLLVLTLPGVSLDAGVVQVLGDPGAIWFTHKIGGHTVGFAVLGLLGVLLKGAPAQVWLRCVGFGAATEALQLLTATRSGRVSDVLFDAFGAGLGVLAGVALVRWRVWAAARR